MTVSLRFEGAQLQLRRTGILLNNSRLQPAAGLSSLKGWKGRSKSPLNELSSRPEVGRCCPQSGAIFGSSLEKESCHRKQTADPSASLGMTIQKLDFITTLARSAEYSEFA
jgi:hypothetical protein